MVETFKELLYWIDLKIAVDGHHNMSDSLNAGHNIRMSLLLVVQRIGRQKDVSCLPANWTL
jgi:hypothetical protein